MAGKKNGRKPNGRNGRRGNGFRRNGNRGRGLRTNATSVVAQGVGAISNVPFGSRVGGDLRCWDAKLPMHLPLPRAVGPYLVMRTTRRFQSSARALVFGTYKWRPSGSTIAYGGGWSPICAVHDYAGADPINGHLNTVTKVMPMDGLGKACTVCPSALSVQVMNPGALMETTGIIYAGVMNTQAAIGGRSESYDSYFDKFIEFQSPRLLSAGKLALRGIQINSYPLNMAELSEFTPIQQDVDDTVTWAPGSVDFSPTGFAPVMVYNSSGPSLALEYLVTTEWRVRFDLDHPASSAHRQHPVASDQLWGSLMAKASALGNGVLDIADVVSNVGKAVSQFQKAAPLLALAP